MSEKLVRIKKLKTGEHMMVTPAYAARTKMLKNSGWVVEDLPDVKIEAKDNSTNPDDAKSDVFDLKDQPVITGSFDEALTEKETGLSLDDQQEETIDLLEVKEEPKTRGRKPKNK